MECTPTLVCLRVPSLLLSEWTINMFTRASLSETVEPKKTHHLPLANIREFVVEE